MTAHSKIKDMRAKIETLKKEPNRKLSVTDIKREGYMPWANHYRTILGIIMADKSGPNILKVKIEGEASRLRYEISAKNLIKYLTEYGPALMSLARNQNKK